jgi:alpha-1,3-rhamnosyltransferase
MIKPAISVAILTFNHADFIEDCLQSVHELEKYFHIEVVIIDDGSSDGTKEKILKWPKNNISYNLNFHIHEGVKSINKNTKKLLQLCKNECVVSLAGDDILIPDGIFYNFENYWDKNIAIVYGNGLKHINNKKTEISVMNKKNIYIFSKQSIEAAINFIETSPPMLFLQGAIMSKSFMIGNKVHDHGFLADDWMINYQIFKSIKNTGHKFIFSNKLVFYHRIHNANTTNDLVTHYKRIEECLSYFNHSSGYKSLCIISFKNILKCFLANKPRESFYFFKKFLRNFCYFLYTLLKKW